MRYIIIFFLSFLLACKKDIQEVNMAYPKLEPIKG